ncbi:unnamed protein product [Paramecium pentaurelia]|uniref:Protein kinase domain-containing protein n=1 Tax=Paramecium pentaurelia TaxID=43138 RepID=A0A8S1VE14_9CILI|nr:unnamed protein product [Paramecium pentaurelia]
MSLNKELIKSQNLTRIQSKAFQIYLINIQDKTYFGYFPKQEYQNNNHLNEFIAGDMQPQNDIKYLRKYNKTASQGFFAFETYKDYILLSELKQLQEQVILKIFQDLLIALFTIHQKGLLGRCFNVNNILLVENQHSVMMEYGFYPDLEYQVPEMIYNQIYNEKIDIFLLGRVLYYLMVGNELPKFQMSNLSEISSDINLSIAQTNYSEGLKKLVISMLSIDVNKRIDYLQLLSKFKNNQFYSLQEQFYKQNTLKNITSKLIDKREKNTSCKLEESQPFEIQQTTIIKKIFEEQQIISSQPLIQEKNNYDDSSEPINQNISSLYPPEFESPVKYTQLNQNQIISKVSETQTQIKTTFYTEETKIKSSLLENDLLLSVLPFLNSDRPQDYLIWNQIYFYLYRFSLMTKLIDELQQYLQKANNNLISIAIYGTKKAQLILKKEYQFALEQCQNLYYIPENEWQKFTQCSEEYKKMVGKMKLDIDVNQKMLLQKDYLQLKKILDQHKNEGVLKELYKFIEKYLEDNNELNSFEDIKRSYRYILTNTLSLFESQEDKNNPYIRLLILMCILINRICDVQHIPQHFNTICQFQKIDSISSIVQIEQFLKRGTSKEFIQQFEELKQTYFSG